MFMKNLSRYLFAPAAIIIMSLSSCATICGGAKYNAEVIVEDHPQAKIEYNGQYIGSGRANIRIKRREANSVVFTVKENGKKQQTFEFTQRVFRGWSLLGTILTWTGYVEGIYIPWGLAVDAITGAWWKPDEYENGIVKVDYDRYKYFLRYEAKDDGTSIPQPTSTQPEVSLETRLEQIRSLKDRGLISDEEYNRMRENILNNY